MHGILRCFMLCAMAGLVSGQARGESLSLVENGSAKCCVVVGPETGFIEPAAFNWTPRNPFLKWAAEDLAAYLGRMSGAAIPVGEKPVAGLLPIYVGAAPDSAATRPAARLTEFGDGYVVDISAKRIVLQGESRRAVYYAASDLLEGMGVRWYGPGALGEVVPTRKSITVETGRHEHSPDFTTRRMWCRPPDELRWMYRNRLGDATIPSGHSMHGYGASLPGWKDRQADSHPEYYSQVDGKAAYFPNLANPRVAEIFAARAIEMLRDGPRGQGQGGKQALGFISFSPDDGCLKDQRPEVAAMNIPGRDPILGMPSFSDAWFGFLNRVCAQVDLQAPGLEFKFGSLAYMNYLMPPRKAKPDRRIIPVVAPIAFNRFTRIGAEGAPSSELLEEVLKEWVTVSPRVGVYFYNFNLADMAMPYTRRRQWTHDIPWLHQLNIRDFCAESHPNWHTMMPGNYVAARLLWDAHADVNRLLDEYYPNYYGPAAKAMREFDAALERAYETTSVFAGGTWGMHRILTPVVMAELERALADAQAKSGGQDPYQKRVEVVRYSLNFAVHYFAMRDALLRIDLENAERHADAFVANYQEAYARFPEFFGKNVSWSPNIERYFELFHRRAVKDGGRIAHEGIVVYALPDELDVHLEKVEGGDMPSSELPAADKNLWRPMKTYSVSLDELGHSFFRGVIWHRHSFALPATAVNAKSLKLWFGGVDSKIRVWLNGDALGEKFVGSFGSWEVDLTPSIRRDKTNELLIAVDNTFPNEIGTGGIVRPAVIYAPR